MFCLQNGKQKIRSVYARKKEEQREKKIQILNKSIQSRTKEREKLKKGNNLIVVRKKQERRSKKRQEKNTEAI